jgi:hypothetical protein
MWMLISFKVMSFITLTTLLVLGWVSIQKFFNQTIDTVQMLHDKEYINSEQAASIISNAQTTLFDASLGHLATFGISVLVAIVAIKGFGDWNDISKEKELIKKMDKEELTNGGLKKFLPKS